MKNPHRLPCSLSPAAAVRFDYASLTLGSLRLLGDTHLKNGTIRLSRDMRVPTSGAGRAFYATAVPVRAGFSTQFAFTVATLNSSSVGGGLAFVVATDGAALGDAGANIGASVAPDAAAVEFDTLMDVQFGDVSGNHVGLDLGSMVSAAAADLGDAATSDFDDGDGDGEVAEYEGECDGDDEETVAVRVRPWLLWRRRGSKRFRVRGGRVVDLAWDLSRTRFPPSGGSPEPSSGYFIAVVVDGEMAVVAGDMAEEAYRKTKARRPAGPTPVLVSRHEHVSMRDGGRGHLTCIVVRGKEREISVDLVSRAAAAPGKERDREKDRADVGMSVSVDGDRVLHVRRLRWKFRGTEKVDHGGGDCALVSWDLLNCLFPVRDTSPPDAAAATLAAAAAVAPPAHAVFVFRFELAGCDDSKERDPADDAKEKELLDKSEGGGGGWAGYVGRWGRGGDWSESSSNGEQQRRKRRGQASRLAKASSSSSASVACVMPCMHAFGVLTGGAHQSATSNYAIPFASMAATSAKPPSKTATGYDLPGLA